MRPVQYFTDDYLERCRRMTPDQILQFLDEFRQLHGAAVIEEKLREQRARFFASEGCESNSEASWKPTCSN